MLHRHGEIILKSAKIPKEAKLKETGKSLVVGHSETGHNHVLELERTQTADIKIFEYEGKTYLDVPLQAKLVHQKEIEKHETQVIAPGTYEFHPRQSYSYAEKIMRRTLD